MDSAVCYSVDNDASISNTAIQCYSASYIGFSLYYYGEPRGIQMKENSLGELDYGMNHNEQEQATDREYRISNGIH